MVESVRSVACQQAVIKPRVPDGAQARVGDLSTNVVALALRAFAKAPKSKNRGVR